MRQMFTGIITDLGQVRSIITDGDTRFEFATAFQTASIDIGASICCSGVCLTVIELGADWFAVSVSEETLSKTTLRDWRGGTEVNFERALKVGDELGGHIVSGHVDGVGKLVSQHTEGESTRMTFEAPDDIANFVATKGSITIDGVSLTVNEVDGVQFGINIIPHTRDVTTLGSLEPGDRVNLEIDMLARYVARLLEKD
jgi:riboflavin synthase